MITNCDACQKHQKHQAKEPLLSHELPNLPFEKVSTDLFEVNGRHYIVMIDAYSSFPEVSQIPSQTSKTVIEVMKNAFCRHGIPNDNGPCYSSREFKFFERAVQTVKNIIKKCNQSKTTPKKMSPGRPRQGSRGIDAKN